MPTNTAASQVIEHLRQMVLQDESALADGQLLARFIEARDEAAFAGLVKRHGRLVWNVCRRLLNQHDAEDAFQATFLVLCRSAASIRRREMLASWLYGVAHQTALRARRTLGRRKAREKQVVNMPEPAAVAQDLWTDLQPILDQELSRLPQHYQVVLLLCDLEGKTRKDAAQQLGVPEGTVGSRLARARAMLAKRLARHGLTVSAGALAAVLAQQAASAGAPAAVVNATIKAVTLVTAGQAAAGVTSVQVAALTEGVLKTMLLNKLKTTALALVALAVVGLGGLYAYQIAQAQQPRNEDRTDKEASPTLVVKNATLESVDVPRRAVSLSMPNNLTGISGNPGPGSRATKQADTAAEPEVALSEAKLKGAKAKLAVATAQVDRRQAEVERLARLVKDGVVDRQTLLEAENQLKASVAERAAAQASVEYNEVELALARSRAPRLRSTRLEAVPLAKGARITIRDKAAPLTDLKPGMRVAVRLTTTEAGRLVITGIAARD